MVEHRFRLTTKAIVILFLIASRAEPAFAVERLLNGAFDSDITNWAPQQGYLAASWDTIGNPTGAMKVINSAAFAGPTSYGVIQCVNGVSPSASYALSGQVRFLPAQATTGYAQVALTWYSNCNCAGTALPGFTTTSV